MPFRPTRLVLQDMLGLPLLVDLMAIRSAVSEAGGDPGRIDMSLPVDLVLDHSMTLECAGEPQAFEINRNREFEVNRERFSFMKACGERFPQLRVLPPGSGIIHQINLEYFGQCVSRFSTQTVPLLVPETNCGTDSHTTMINALGILGWGIGGLEAESIMFGEAVTINVPKVVGIECIGSLDHRATATDVALTLAQMLRQEDVVDKFVELFGAGYTSLSTPDRATIANMSPEYGSTCVFCPVDENTIRYLEQTGRPKNETALVEQFHAHSVTLV